MCDYIYKITCGFIYESHVIIYVGRTAALRRQKIDLRQNGISGPDLFLRSQHLYIYIDLGYNTTCNYCATIPTNQNLIKVK